MWGFIEGAGGWPRMEVWLPLGGGGCCPGRTLGPIILGPPSGGALPKIDDPTGGPKLVSLVMGGAPRIELVGGWGKGEREGGRGRGGGGGREGGRERQTERERAIQITIHVHV